MNRNIHKFILSVILVAGVHYKVFGDEITEEELFFMKIPHVVTASRKEQLITEAPATVTVITAEDIKQSGATSIPDVLRMVSGVDVMTISVDDQQVSIRGFNGFLSGRMLLFIDGLSFYWDAMGNIFWNFFSLEEIERIEIVKSPGSSLYGANAYCGVINIITKSPAQSKGTKLDFTYGDYNTLLGSILHAGVTEKIDYKVSAEWDSTNEWRDRDEIAGKIIRGNALVEYKIGEENKLSLSGGRIHLEDSKTFCGETTGANELTGSTEYLKLDYVYSNLKFRTFMRIDDSNALWLRTDEKQPWHTTTTDAEVQHSPNIGEEHSLIWGLNYRYNTVRKNSAIPESHDQNLWALFAEDQFKITDKFTLTFGGRYDRHPLVKGRFSPRGNISFSPVKEHILRFSLAKAFYNPTFINSYLSFERPMTMTKEGVTFPYTYFQYGNEGLKSEGITSVEVGYRSIWIGKIISNLNLFYNTYTDFLYYKRSIILYTPDELIALGLPSGLLLPKAVTDTFKNIGSASGIGGEIDFDIFITGWLSGNANYSYQAIKDKEDYLVTAKVNERDRVRPDYPKNKVNAGLKAKFKNGISTNLMAHWVDKTERLINDLDGNEYLAKLGDYIIVNTCLAYTFLDKKAEVSLAVFNLFNNKHYEYPSGINLPDASSDEIGRRITVQAGYRF